MIAIVHPGEMGASLGAALVEGGHQVGWASSGRGPETRRRAAAAGLRDLGTVPALREHCEVVMSICPPHVGQEWDLSQPGLRDRLHRAEVGAAEKGWRWTGEMEEIATAFGDVGTPSAFGTAAAAIFAGYNRPQPDSTEHT